MTTRSSKHVHILGLLALGLVAFMLAACADEATSGAGSALRDAGVGTGGAAQADSARGNAGGAAATPGGGGGAQEEPPITYEEWLALGCDCTPENPCPMLCGGATDLPEFPGIAPPQENAEWALKVCDVSLDPQRPCTGAFYSACGAVSVVSRVKYLRPPGGELRVTQYFAPTTLERTGWEFRFFVGRICGGVVPRLDCAEGGSAPEQNCASDQTPLCICPPPPCTVCPNGRSCTEDSQCISGTCDGVQCRAPASCSDGVHNTPESHTDCGGGGVCPACAGGKTCNADNDCQSQSCADGVCAS